MQNLLDCLKKGFLYLFFFFPLSCWRKLRVIEKFQAEECMCGDHIHRKRMWEGSGESKYISDS